MFPCQMSKVSQRHWLNLMYPLKSYAIERARISILLYFTTDSDIDALVLVEQLSKICSSWSNSAWDEIEWATRLKDIKLREILDTRKANQMVIQNSGCLLCPKFLKHFAMCHDEWLIKENITQLRQLMSDQNLQLLPDYEQRIQVLIDLDFIDEGSRVQLKGKVACEVPSTTILSPIQS